MIVKDVIDKFSMRLKEKGVKEPELNSLYIISKVLKLSKNELIFERDKKIGYKEFKEILRKIEMKEKGWPLSWILEKHNFCGLEIILNPGVFVPRPETEEMVIKVNEQISLLKCHKKIKVLDFCAGSGCISIFLAFNNPDIVVYSVEKTERGVKCIKDNIKKFGLENVKVFKNDNMLFLKEKFDVIVSNPPYIPSSIISGLDIEVLMEPRIALDGGDDGLKLIKMIERDAPRKLTKDGILFVEFGDSQYSKILSLFSKWAELVFFRDMQGKYRFLKAVKNG